MTIALELNWLSIKNTRCVPVLGGSQYNKCHARVCCGTLCTTVGELNWQNFHGWVCVFIGDKTVTIDANPMRLVHSILCCPCTTRRIGCGLLIVNVLLPIKTQNYTHVLFCCRTICTTAYVKFGQKNGWQMDICYKLANFQPPKTGTRHHLI